MPAEGPQLRIGDNPVPQSGVAAAAGDKDSCDGWTNWVGGSGQGLDKVSRAPSIPIDRATARDKKDGRGEHASDQSSVLVRESRHSVAAERGARLRDSCLRRYWEHRHPLAKASRQNAGRRESLSSSGYLLLLSIFVEPKKSWAAMHVIFSYHSTDPSPDEPKNLRPDYSSSLAAFGNLLLYFSEIRIQLLNSHLCADQSLTVLSGTSACPRHYPSYCACPPLFRLASLARSRDDLPKSPKIGTLNLVATPTPRS